MGVLLLLTNALAPPAEVLPALSLLSHRIRVAPPDVGAVLETPSIDAVLVDARRDLVASRALLRVLRATSLDLPFIAIVTEGGLAAVRADWGADDVILDTAGPAEVEARLRLVAERLASARGSEPRLHEEDEEIRSGELVVDEASYTARVAGRALQLAYKEFELLKFLAQHPGRVFTRAQLLQEVWGYDYFGGTRTVDVHVRRLRAKLGPEHDHMIGTVRNVGYRFAPTPTRDAAPATSRSAVPGRAG